MRVGLFIPCYIEQFYPDVGLATVEVLERCGVEVVYPPHQTCCGQPMANTGCVAEARPLAERFLRVFGDFPYIVGPSGSCVAMIRHHFGPLVSGRPGYPEVCERTFELCEFLVDVLELDRWEGRFPHRVGLHESCHGLRELGLGSPSERMSTRRSTARRLLESLEGIELAELERADECCGFGGTFAVNEEAVSCRMGLDRIADHEQAGVEVMTAGDMSCLMHLSGLIRRRKRPIQTMHVAQILAGRPV